MSLIASGSVFWILSAFYSGHILSPFAHSVGGPLAPGGLWLLFGLFWGGGIGHTHIHVRGVSWCRGAGGHHLP